MTARASRNAKKGDKARAAVTFGIPAGTKAQSCMSCGKPIYFIETPRGKRMPVDPDGAVHFSTCNKSDPGEFK